MNPPRFLIWSIHERAWRTELQDCFTTSINNAHRYEFWDAKAQVQISNMRSGNVPNEAMVPEPKETL